MAKLDAFSSRINNKPTKYHLIELARQAAMENCALKWNSPFISLFIAMFFEFQGEKMMVSC